MFLRLRPRRGSGSRKRRRPFSKKTSSAPQKNCPTCFIIHRQVGEKLSLNSRPKGSALFRRPVCCLSPLSRPLDETQIQFPYPFTLLSFISFVFACSQSYRMWVSAEGSAWSFYIPNCRLSNRETSVSYHVLYPIRLV